MLVGTNEVCEVLDINFPFYLDLGKTRQPLAILVSDWQKLRKSLKLEVQMIIIQYK